MSDKKPSAIVGMETSGAMRRRLQQRGIFTVSVDILPSEDGTPWGPLGGHVVGDVFDTFWRFHDAGIEFDAGVFHPDCTYLTNSAAWAFKDPDFTKYPGVGYHQRVKVGTLTGAARRAAQEAALADVRRILELPIRRKVLENPIGAITKVRRASQIVQPYQWGDDASKATVLILDGLLPIQPQRSNYVEPRMVCRQCGARSGYLSAARGCEACGAESADLMPRWSNQTDSGQNALSPSDDRWKNRARTYPGIATALADNISAAINGAAS